MAGSHTQRRKVNSRKKRTVYPVEGTVAKEAEYVPDERYESDGRTKGKRSASVQHRKRSRARAQVTGLGYAVFILFISIFTVASCIGYLRKKATITSQVKMNENLTSELSTLRSENAALQEDVNNSIDWEHIRDVAVNKLGMKYATKNQIVWYNTDDNSYIMQYKKVPSGD